jgi:peptide chain release factor 3
MNRKIIGTVGALQYEVIQYRLEHEYGAKCTSSLCIKHVG